MKSKYNVGQTVSAFIAFGTIAERSGNPICTDAAFYTGVIKLVAANKAEHMTWYRLEYIGLNGKAQSRMVFEDEIDFVQMTIR